MKTNKEKALRRVYRHPLLTDEDLRAIGDQHEEVLFGKGDFFLSCGEKTSSYLILENGLMRSFLYDYEGNDITTHFFSSDEVVIEVLSLFQQTPSGEYIQALTDCVCWKIELERFEVLSHSIKGLTEWALTWMSEQLFLSKQRAVEMITQRATERYLKLIREKPQVIRQAPLKQIATYLGITDTSLSRIRKELTKGTPPAAG